MHEITAGHRSLSGTISYVTNRIRFLPVTMTGSFSNFNSISYTEDRHELRVTGTKCRLPDTMSDTGKISISGAVWVTLDVIFYSFLQSKHCSDIQPWIDHCNVITVHLGNLRRHTFHKYLWVPISGLEFLISLYYCLWCHFINQTSILKWKPKSPIK